MKLRGKRQKKILNKQRRVMLSNFKATFSILIKFGSFTIKWVNLTIKSILFVPKRNYWEFGS